MERLKKYIILVFVSALSVGLLYLVGYIFQPLRPFNFFYEWLRVLIIFTFWFSFGIKIKKKIK